MISKQMPANASPADFSAERAFRHIEALAREPRPIGTAAHTRADDAGLSTSGLGTSGLGTSGYKQMRLVLTSAHACIAPSAAHTCPSGQCQGVQVSRLAQPDARARLLSRSHARDLSRRTLLTLEVGVATR